HEGAPGLEQPRGEHRKPVRPAPVRLQHAPLHDGLAGPGGRRPRHGLRRAAGPPHAGRRRLRRRHRARGARPPNRWGVRDPPARRFAYVSRTDDDNPSRAHWSWELKRIETGTEITVSWELRPRTFFRKRLAAPLRHRQLKNEVRASIPAAAAAVKSRAGA